MTLFSLPFNALSKLTGSVGHQIEGIYTAGGIFITEDVGQGYKWNLYLFSAQYPLKEAKNIIKRAQHDGLTAGVNKDGAFLIT
jgi:hypothetical protein